MSAAITAHADDGLPLRLFAATGYGTQDDDDAGAFGLAFGIKGSTLVLDWMHLGVSGTYHVGTRFGDEINRVHYAGAELGARFDDDLVGVTPYLTGGASVVNSQRNTEPSFWTWYLGLGLCMDLAPVDWLLLGIDVRILTIPNGVSQSDNSGSTGTVDLLFLIGTRFDLAPET